MARTRGGRYTQFFMGVSDKEFEELDALRQKNESWRKFFVRILPTLKEALS